MNLFSSKADAQKRVPWLQGSDDIPAGVILHFKFIFFVAGVNLHKKNYLQQTTWRDQELSNSLLPPRIPCSEALVAPCLDR